MIRIPTATKTAKGRGIQLTAERLVNMYAEQAPEGAKSPIVVHGCPGLTLFGSVGEKIRGMYRTPADGKLYVVAAQSLFSIASDGRATNLGTIAGFGRVGMADNGTELCIVTGARGYIYTVLDGLSVIDDRDFPGADTVTFIDGFFVFNNRSNGEKGQFFISDLLDGTTYDALDFATAERYPDNLTRVFADHSELLLFGDESIEVWFNAGNADFPFSRAQGSVIEQGLGARWTVAKVDESVFWLDQEGIVRRLQGQTPLRISTHAIENAISRGDWTNATAYSYTDEGHQFYCLTIPAANLQQTAGTYCYDAATGLWHERQSYEMDHSRVGFYTRAFGKHIVGDIDNGNLYEMSLDFYDENGVALISEMVFPQIQNDGDRFIVSKLQLDIASGDASRTVNSTITFGGGDWTQRTSAFGTTEIAEIGAGNGVLIAAGYSGKASRSVDDGVTWSSLSPGFGSTTIADARYGGGIWLLSGFDGKRSRSIDNGTTWTALSVGQEKNIWSADYANGLWVCCGEDGLVETSPDALTWTNRNISGASGNLYWVNRGDSLWVAVGDGGDLFSSPDAITWTQRTSSFGSTIINTVDYGDGLWVAAGYSGKLATSTDGINWTQRTSSFGSTEIREVAYGDGLWIAAGDEGKIASSPDGVNWTQVDDSSFGSTLISGITYAERTFVACGRSGKLATLSGVGVTSESIFEGDPEIMLDVSGNTRTFDMTQGWRSMGKRGEYDTRVIWRRLGQHRSFTPRLAISSPVKRAVFAAYAEIEPCK